MNVARAAFDKANLKKGDEALLLYLQSIAASLLEIMDNGGDLNPHFVLEQPYQEITKATNRGDN